MITGSERHTCRIIIEKQIAKRDGIVTKYPSNRVDSWARASCHSTWSSSRFMTDRLKEGREEMKEDFAFFSSKQTEINRLGFSLCGMEKLLLQNVTISVFHSGNIVMPRFFSCRGDTSSWSDPTMEAQHMHILCDIMLSDQQMIKFVSEYCGFRFCHQWTLYPALPSICGTLLDKVMNSRTKIQNYNQEWHGIKR